MLAIVIVEGLAIVVLGLLVVGLLRSHAEILKSLHELGAGVEVDAAPRRAVPVEIGARTGRDVIGTTPDGSAAAIGVVGAPQHTLLAFLSTTCVTCLPFWDEFNGRPELPAGTRLVVVLQDQDSDKRLRTLAGPTLTVVKSSTAWEDYEVPGSPHFILVEAGTGRLLGEGTGNTWDQVHDLMAQASQGLLVADPADRDNPTRIDAELAVAGITQGHPSLYQSLDADPGAGADPPGGRP